MLHEAQQPTINDRWGAKVNETRWSKAASMGTIALMLVGVGIIDGIQYMKEKILGIEEQNGR